MRARREEMKSFVRRGSAALFLSLVGAQVARAQITGPIEFTTTFPFTVGYAVVPAGTYTIKPDDDNSKILELSGAHTGVLFQTDDVQARQAPSKTEVVFKRYGDGYLLKDIWLEGSGTGSETIAVESERHMAKHGASKGELRVAARKKSTISKTQ
jgi:hypothetical protein